MTLLDSIETEVLERNPGFKLPKLHESNIFQADFFDPGSCRRSRPRRPIESFYALGKCSS